MNLRVVLLERKKSMEQHCFRTLPLDSLNSSEKRPWLVLGHFDAMYSYPLEYDEGKMFSTIRNTNGDIVRNNRTESYLYPLYLLCAEEDEGFWRERKPYISVVRIHYYKTILEKDRRAELKTKLRKAAGDRCDVTIADSVELSDLILAAQSDRLGPLLDFVLSLWAREEIGTAYPYVGIYYDYIDAGESTPVDGDDKISLVTMRFPASALYEGLAFADILPLTPRSDGSYEELHMVSGVDNIMFARRDFPVARLLSIYRAWLTGDNAFSGRVTTRVGMSLPLPADEKPDAAPRELQRACSSLIEKTDSILKKVDSLRKDTGIDTICGWSRSLTELTRTMLRMTKSPALDEFVYLLLPGADGFLQNLDKRLDDDIFLDRWDRKSSEYIENWMNLSEHIMRMEGQMTQDSDLRPILYDIPVSMIEYALAFLVKCAEKLEAGDREKSNLRFQLIPRLNHRLAVSDVFRFDPDVPHLVQMIIPLHDLYEPEKLLIMLCHEVSHLAGIRSRCRLTREECFAEIVSYIIASILSHNPAVLVPKLCEILKGKLRDSGRRGRTVNGSGLLLKDLKAELQSWIDQIYGDESELVRSLLWEIEEPVSFRSDYVRNMRLLRDPIWEMIDNFAIQFREIYADICMMHILDIRTENYFEMLVGDLASFPEKESDKPSMGSVKQEAYQHFAVRACVCLRVMERDIPHNLDGLAGRLCRYAENLELLLSGKVSGWNQVFYPKETIEPLVRYGRACMASLEESNIDVNVLRDMYRYGQYADKEFDNFMHEIIEHRENVIGQYD